MLGLGITRIATAEFTVYFFLLGVLPVSENLISRNLSAYRSSTNDRMVKIRFTLHYNFNTRIFQCSPKYPYVLLRLADSIKYDLPHYDTRLFHLINQINRRIMGYLIEVFPPIVELCEHRVA